MRARLVRCALVALSLVLLAGCGYTEVHEVVLRVPGPPASHEPEIYVGGDAPRRPAYEIAILQAIGHGGDADIEDTTAALRVRAAQLGCDAVVKVHYDQGYSMSQAVGVCVRWATGVVASPPEAAPAPPAPAPSAPPPSSGTTI